MALLCVRGVRKDFSWPSLASSRIGISFGRQEHNVISLLFKLFANLTRKIVKSMGEINLLHCTIMIIVVQFKNDYAISFDELFERELLYNFLLSKEGRKLECKGFFGVEK